MALVEAAATGFREDSGITVSQNNHRTLNQPHGARMALFVELQAMVQCGVGDTLDAVVDGRIDLDVPIQKLTNSDLRGVPGREMHSECLEFFEDIFRRGGGCDGFRGVGGHMNWDLLEAQGGI